MKSHRTHLPTRFPIQTRINKSPVDLFDLLLGLYDKELKSHPENSYLGQHSSPGNIINQIYTFAWYLRFLPEHGKILDWGCNHAPDSCMVRAVFGDDLEIHGCDFREPDMFKEFNKAARLSYRKLSDHVHLPYEDNTFDAVIASGALEHAVFDYKSLEELYRVMKPECKLIITYLPNRLSYYEWIKENISKKDFHPRRYGLKEIRKLLKHNGFLPIEASAQIFLWEQKLAALGFAKNNKLLIKFLRFLFPIHLISGCFKLVAVKKDSM